MFNNAEDEPVTKNKILEKTQLAEEKGIHLLHIFENEWIDPRKRKIWESVIRYKQQEIERKIYARKTEIKTFDAKVARSFFSVNHLQGGAAIGNTFYGLFFQDELVSVMTFGKSRFSNDYEWELVRFASKLNIAVVGGAQKLLKHFIKTHNPKNIVSYANRRWSNGHLYETLGFTFIRDSEPNYFYFKPNELILQSRNKFQKHKLKELFPSIYDDKKTETQIMYEAGYRKIYDAGNKVYLLTLRDS